MIRFYLLDGRVLKRGNMFAEALLLIMIAGWEKPAGSKHKLPSPADHVKYLPHSEECAMQKYGIIVLDELLLCAAFFSYFLRKLRETMTQGYRAPIVAESRKQGKKTEPSL